MSYKAENWPALSHEQFFSKHCILDICCWAFKCKCKDKLALIEIMEHSAVFRIVGQLHCLI